MDTLLQEMCDSLHIDTVYDNTSRVRHEAENETQEGDVQTDIDYHFNSETGLWSFPSKSMHSSKKQNDYDLGKNACARDDWNNIKLKETNHGFLKGVNLIPDIPNDSCACGAGWQDEQRPNGKTSKINRTLVVYTINAPVKCDVYVRSCLNSQNLYTNLYYEEEKLCIHVLSNETAAVCCD